MNKRITQARQPNPRQRLSQNRETAICKTSRLGALRQRGAAPTVNMKDITPPAPAERAFAGRRQPADAPPAARRISKDITAAIDLMLDFGHLVTQCIEGSRRVERGLRWRVLRAARVLNASRARADPDYHCCTYQMTPALTRMGAKGARIMRYELTDREWSAIKPMLPNKPRGVPRVNDRRVLNGIFWVLRSGAPWRDLLDAFGPYTTCYNRFVRGDEQVCGPRL